MAGGMCGRGACVAGEHAWWGWHAWQGVCMERGAWWGGAWQGGVHGRRWPLQQTVCILLECILVLHVKFCTIFLSVLKWVECIPLVMFTYDVTKCKKDQRCR